MGSAGDSACNSLLTIFANRVCSSLRTVSNCRPSPLPALTYRTVASSPDLSILHEEMKFNCRADGAYLACFDKKTTHAQISNSRRVFSSAAAPEGPHTMGRFNASVMPSGMNNVLCQAALAHASRPLCLRARSRNHLATQQGTQCLI